MWKGDKMSLIELFEYIYNRYVFPTQMQTQTDSGSETSSHILISLYNLTSGPGALIIFLTCQYMQ